MARIQDVAAHAGVSPTTVSRYVNGRIRLPAGTAARIDSAISSLDYRPSALARRLFTGRTEMIGLVVPQMKDLFFPELAAAIEDEADRHGFSLVLFTTRAERSREITVLNRLHDRFVDGLIMVATGGGDPVLAELLAKRRQVLLVHEEVPDARVPRITYENTEGIAAATRHLIAAGHRHIAFLGGPLGLSSTQERLVGFRRTMSEAGITTPASHMVRTGIVSREAGIQATEALMAGRTPPTALLTASDEATVGAMSALSAAGLSVPDHVSVAAFCGGAVCGLLRPSLAVARKPVDALGRKGLQSLLALLRGDALDPVIRVPVEFQPGDSVGPPQASK